MSALRDEAKEVGGFTVRTFIYGLLTLVVLGGLTYFSMFGKEFFAKWNEQIRYEVQQESQAHRDGLRRNLSQMQIQYAAADAAGKTAIAAAARQQYGQIDSRQIEEMPDNLQDFLRTVGVY